MPRKGSQLAPALWMVFGGSDSLPGVSERSDSWFLPHGPSNGCVLLSGATVAWTETGCHWGGRREGCGRTPSANAPSSSLVLLLSMLSKSDTIQDLSWRMVSFSSPSQPLGAQENSREAGLPTDGKPTSPAPAPRRQKSPLSTWDFKDPFCAVEGRGKPVGTAQSLHWGRPSCPAAGEVTCLPPPPKVTPFLGTATGKDYMTVDDKGLVHFCPGRVHSAGPSSSCVPCRAGEAIPGFITA